MAYKNYITSLKGIACMFVAFGHFIGIVKYAESISIELNWLTFLERIRLDFLLHETFWLYLFFVVSGYLVASSKIRSLSDLAVKSVSRFCRLAFPILFASLIILVFNYTIGFKNSETIALFENSWYQTAYDSELSVVSALRSPFDTLILAKCIFNSPYWVLRSMFAASIMIYLCSYLQAKIKKSFVNIALQLLFLGLGFATTRIIFACLVGALVAYNEALIQKFIQNKYICAALLLIGFLLCTVHMVYGAIVFFSVFILTISKFKTAKRALELPCFVNLGKISFGIYSFHWPIFCSVGALLVLRLWNEINPAAAVTVSIIVSTLITTALSAAYYFTAEKWSGILTKKIAGISTKILKKIGIQPSSANIS